MEHLEDTITGFCVGVLSSIMLLKAMHVLSIALWIMSLPLLTPAICLVLIKMVNDTEEDKGGGK